LEVRKPCRRGITRGSATLALGFFHNCFRESQKADGYSRLSYLEADGDRVNLFLGEKCRGEVRAQRQKQGYVFALSLLWASITPQQLAGFVLDKFLVGEYKTREHNFKPSIWKAFMAPEFISPMAIFALFSEMATVGDASSHSVVGRVQFLDASNKGGRIARFANRGYACYFRDGQG
jgi:catechol 2,3-dioxygenase-like lactoylglutathione lyase family enzyme